MSMEEKQLSGAMRIFEALSGVDESLLIKCEDADVEGVSVINKADAVDETVVVDKTVAKNSGTGVLRMLKGLGNKYQVAGILAAAVCVLTVGVAWWSGTPRFIARDAASTMEDAAEAGMEQAVMEAVPAAAQEAAGAEEVPAKAANTEESDAKAENSSNYEYVGAVTQGSMKDNGTSNETNVVTEDSIVSAPMDTRSQITLAEARAINVLGEYVPDKLPEGYAWEFGMAAENQDTGKMESIALWWVNGMDSIEISISQADVDSVTLVNIEEPESYDVHLYVIPYADTVPEKYRESFHNPVFCASDMSLDIVEARMKSIADAGDTDTPRGSFAVLYEDGVLVRFSGRGSAEDIWEMFRSIR